MPKPRRRVRINKLDPSPEPFGSDATAEQIAAYFKCTPEEFMRASANLIVNIQALQAKSIRQMIFFLIQTRRGGEDRQ